jgi:alpha-amylase
MNKWMRCLGAALWLLGGVATAQDVMLQGWYWDYPKVGCAGYGGPSWAATMTARSSELATAGFTHAWLPPLSEASFGDCSNGYDPQDLYDYGQVSGRTGVGTGAEVAAWISSLAAHGISPVADVVYNHRDGGAWEDNPAARAWVTSPPPPSCTTWSPYPVNGKLRYRLPLGGTSANGSGDYYFKFSSASARPSFNGRAYKLHFRTQLTASLGGATQEAEPNGGGDCGQPFQTATLGRDYWGWQEVGTSCDTDEIRVQLGASDFLATGDFLELYVEEPQGSGTGVDVRPYGIWSASRGQDIVSELAVQTRTNFAGMPSGLGAMTWQNFKPNGQQPTCLTGDEDTPFFFFDVEHTAPSTGIAYRDWTAWLWSSLGVRGLRMDAVKHFPAWFAGLMLEELHSAGRVPTLVVGEHFTTDAIAVKAWIDGVTASMSPAARAAIPVRAFDFELRAALKSACDDTYHDARNVFTSGLVDRAGASGFQSVSFINNHDFRTVGEHLLSRAELAYAYILTNNKVGLPCVFLPDYDGLDIYGAGTPLPELRASIDRLMWVQRTFIAGSTQVEYLNRFGTPRASVWLQGGPYDVLLYQLRGGVGGRDVIVAINFEGQRVRANHAIETASAPLGTRFGIAAGSANHLTPVVEQSPNGIANSIYLDLPASSYAVFVEDYVEPPVPYCTAGTSSAGCAPSLGCSGTPSLAASSGFLLHASGVEGQRQGLLFYGIAGRASAPWGGGFLCVKSPTQRLGAQSSGGTSGACDGTLSGDWLAFRAARPDALGAPFLPGSRVQAQGWYRDPPAPKSTQLTRALEFTLAP